MAQLLRAPAKRIEYVMGREVNMMYESAERLEQGCAWDVRSRTGGGLGINKL